MRARRGAVVAALVAVACLWAVGAGGPAWAGSGERVRSFAAEIVVARDGTMTVVETISYDFGPLDRHGIFRDIPVRLHFDDRYDRLYPITLVSVEGGSPGTPDDVAVSDEGSRRRFRIGDPDLTITGRHTYVITYRVRGALNSFDDHEELYWNITGNDWAVPIDAVSVQVTVPGGVADVACFSGPTGSSLGCDGSSFSGSRATFAQSGLDSFEGVTVVVGMPEGSVTVPPPVLEERWSFRRAYSITPLTVGLSSLLTALLVFGLARMAWLRGRDRRWRGSQVDMVFGNAAGTDEAVPVSLFDRPLDPVEYEPPEGILPGQLGTLLDEVANPLDVTATIVHLAVRGYLRIEEVPKKGFFGKPDWCLHKLKEGDGLRPYERSLHSGLFQTGDSVALSDLKRTFAARLTRVQEALYEEMVSHGWFAGRPDKVRVRWVLIGVGLLVAALALAIVLAAATHFGLLGVPFVVGAVMMLALSQRMPRRTPKGVAMVRRVAGFRRFIAESEAERARFAERANLFSEYLPYAIVFGVTEKWAKAFEGLEVAAAQATSWYVSSEPFSMGRFGSSMDSFAITTAGTITATAASSGGSGFGGGGSSGGGGGGGGGGSW